jgi:hypothetical protein
MVGLMTGVGLDAGAVRVGGRGEAVGAGGAVGVLFTAIVQAENKKEINTRATMRVFI